MSKPVTIAGNAASPLRLNDSQLALVRRAAALLSPNLRGKFLQSIARELADVDPIDDEAVQRGGGGDYGCRCAEIGHPQISRPTRLVLAEFVVAGVLPALKYYTIAPDGA